MLRDTATCRENHERFLTRIISSEVVWGLRDSIGTAYCDSNDADTVVLMFWSDRGYASRVKQKSFPEYEPQEISLFDFLFRWLPGMAKDGVLAGTNWTGDLVGLEFDPQQLRQEILAGMSEEQIQQYQAQLKRKAK